MANDLNVEVTAEWRPLREALDQAESSYYPYLYDGIRRSYFYFRKVFNAHVRSQGVTSRFGRAFSIQIMDPGKRVARRGNKPIRLLSFPRNTKKGKMNDIVVSVDTLSRIAKLVEEGAFISPKKKYFRIPIGPARTASGGTKSAYKGGRRYRDDIVPIIRPGKPPFLAKKRVFKTKGKPPKITPVFLLLKKIYVKKRLGLMRTWDQTEDGRAARIDKSFDKYMNEFWG